MSFTSHTHANIDAWLQRISAAKCEPGYSPRALRDLYAQATVSISLSLDTKKQSADERLLTIWLEHLSIEALSSSENRAEIRDKYKYLKKNRIGAKSASLFVQWARFEADCGDLERAKSILKAGIEADAQPMEPLLQEIEAIPLRTQEVPPTAEKITSANISTRPFIPPTSDSSTETVPQASVSVAPELTDSLGPAPSIPTSSAVTKASTKASTLKMQALLASYKKSIGHLVDEPTGTLINPTTMDEPASPVDSKATKDIKESIEIPETKAPQSTYLSTTLASTCPLAAAPSIVTPSPGPSEYLMPIKSCDETPLKPTQQTQSHSAPPPLLPAGGPASSKSLYITVNGTAYKRIELIGRGASSKVYKVLSERGAIFALKKVKLDRQDAAAVEGYLNEIELLRKLAGAEGIIRLVDSEVCFVRKHLLLLLEYGEIDLAHLLMRDKSFIGNLNFIRMQWTHMLQAVHQIHNEKIVHSDLKPANFLIVEGKLKLIDFGIAKSIPNDTTNVQRDYQTGTLNYMAPEAILFTESTDSSAAKLKLGRPSDIWSLGCILYQLVYGAPPFSSLAVVQKLNAIVDPNYKIPFKEVGDASLMQVLRSCLDRDPKSRMTIPQLLAHPFLHPHAPARGSVAVTRADIVRMVEAGRSLSSSVRTFEETVDLFMREFENRSASKVDV